MVLVWALHPLDLVLQVLHLVVPLKLIHQIFLSLLELGIEGVRTVREAAHPLVHQVIWESLSLLADVARNGSYLL